MAERDSSATSSHGVQDPAASGLGSDTDQMHQAYDNVTRGSNIADSI